MQTNFEAKSLRKVIDKATLERWNEKKYHGKIANISKFTGLSVVTISNALKGLATEETETKINLWIETTV